MEPFLPCTAGGFFTAEPLGKPPTLPCIRLKSEYLPNTQITNGRNGKFLSPMQVSSVYVIPAGSNINVYLNTLRFTIQKCTYTVSRKNSDTNGHSALHCPRPHHPPPHPKGRLRVNKRRQRRFTDRHNDARRGDRTLETQ